MAHTWRANAAVAGGYWLLGLAALYLAIPPLIASPLWPAAGFASLMVMRFGYRLAPGVFLGSVLAILTEAALRGEPIDWAVQTPLVLMISSGAVARSHLATWLVRRFAWDAEADHPIHLKAMLLAGPVATLVSAVFGTGSLAAVGLAGSDQLLYVWFTWWLGDTVGTMAVWPVFTPFLWTGPHRSLRNWMLGTLPVFGVAAATMGVFVLVRAQEHDLESEVYRDEAVHIASHVEVEVKRSLDVLDAVRAMLREHPAAPLEEYQRFVDTVVGNDLSTHGVAWVRPVHRDERAAYEQARSAELARPFQITEPDGQGGYRPAGARDLYLVVHLTAPATRHNETLGLDTLSTGSADTYGIAARSRSRETTAPFRLAQDKEGRLSVLVIEPVWLTSPSAEEPDGYLALLLRPSDLMAASAGPAEAEGLDIRLLTSAPQPNLLFEQRADDRLAPEFQHTVPIDVPGDNWQLVITPTLGSAVTHASLAPWFLLLTGSLTTAGLGLLVQSLNDRRGEVQLTVERQTRDLARQNEELARARDAAEAANRAKSTFIATLSHELRTPLHGVTGMLELLEPTLHSEQQRNLASTALESASALLAVIGDLLDVASLESGKVAFVDEPFSVRDVTEDAMCFVAAVAARKHINLWCIVDPAVPTGMVGDPARVRQILLNLVGNAVKFTPSGRVCMKVQLDEHAGQPEIVFRVEDSGPGVAKEDLTRIFEPFYQAQQGHQRSYGGTGLGLMISRDMARSMHGDVALESTSPEGSCFALRLPLRATEMPREHLAAHTLVLAGNDPCFVASAFAACPTATREVGSPAQLAAAVADAGDNVWVLFHEDEGEWSEAVQALEDARVIAVGSQIAASPPWPGQVRRLLKPLTSPRLHAVIEGPAQPTSPPRHAAPPSGRRFLVVDDHGISRFVAVAVLRNAGHEVIEAESGAEAVTVIEADPHIDAVLMDCQMPGMDGYETTRRIRALPQGAAVPILAVTANVGEEDRRACTDAGMDDVIGKPFTQEELLACVARHVSSASSLPH